MISQGHRIRMHTSSDPLASRTGVILSTGIAEFLHIEDLLDVSSRLFWLIILRLRTSISIANFRLVRQGDSPCGMGIGELAGEEADCMQNVGSLRNRNSLKFF
ncbi:hypothetical protein NPIL_412631 [Nephila pilipes]|uniref:Uncharacterized protein n=1 Tax=Nephila pilipes TaxID=299642 RepID=A0A8X6UXS4_NEPPI|nr:hypothetical protein NPIL_412631 [Nephila pilipes]